MAAWIRRLRFFSFFFTAVFRRKPRKPENPGTMAGKTQKSGGEKNLNAMETGRGFRSPKMNPRGRDWGPCPLWPFGIQGGSNALALFFRGVRKQADCLHTVASAASQTLRACQPGCFLKSGPLYPPLGARSCCKNIPHQGVRELCGGAAPDTTATPTAACKSACPHLLIF